MLEAGWWGLLGGSSLLLGAVAVMVRPPTPTVLGLVMGFGAGVLISAVSFELVDEAVATGGTGGAVVGFFVGATTFFVGDVAIARIGAGQPANLDSSRETASSPLSIVLGTVLDGVPESAVLGLTLLENGTIGVSMLVAVFVSNIPEAVAASSDLLDEGWSRRHIMTLWSAVAGVSALAAAGGYWLLDGASPGAVAFIFAFAGGAILAMLSTSMIPEAYTLAGRTVGLVVTFGFAVSYLITYLSD